MLFQICSECINQNNQSSCCTGSCVPLTMKDIERISALGHQIPEFVIAGEYGKQFVEGFEPWWVRSFVQKGNYFYKLNTKTRENGECVFLKPGVGCTLGEHRPYVCRMYPFWVNEQGEVVYEPEERESCTIPKKGFTVDQGLGLVDESRERVQTYFREVKEDCEMNRDRHEEVMRSILGDL